MASFLGLQIVQFVALLGSLLLTYHVAILVEGRVDVATRAPCGDIYDCIEFHIQLTFDHPLLKHDKIKDYQRDLIRAKLSSNALADQYRAGVSYQTELDKTIYGASGLLNFWNPSVNQDQFSLAEIALQSGSYEKTSVIKYGWRVDPQLYGDYVVRSFAYWTVDGGQNTGCYNILCRGFVQTHRVYTPCCVCNNKTFKKNVRKM
ncbi:hypothetical protein C5167_020247 [Papaver somniferum]|uniref:Neprosin PEP catalytic domain-containing protein n=1 Tax=Papaver somniferum TaxID=3469 RepID=A0A4Y7IVL2_PAPSO|nr:hypothetical protein C5167_020247 [Papaver somniferum]